MKLRILAVAALLFPVHLALADGDFSRTLNVSAQPDLYVNTGSGSIRIHAGAADRIEIRGHVHANASLFGGGDDLEARVRHILADPPIAQDGNVVHVGQTNDRNLLQNISIEYEIAVPTSVALNLRSGSGNLQIDQAGRYLTATTGSGSIRVNGLHGPAEMQTGSGDIELDETAAGDVKSKSGSGSIRVRGLNGALTANTGSGSIEGVGRLGSPSRLSTGSGSIRLRLTPDSHFDLSASTGSGAIRVNLPGAPQQTSSSSRHHLSGPVNGGGGALEAHTGSGSIEISPT